MEEIRRSPVEVGSLPQYLQGLDYIPGGAGFLPSTVVISKEAFLLESEAVISLPTSSNYLFSGACLVIYPK